MPKVVDVQFIGVSPYSQSRKLNIAKPRTETWEAHEQRTWRDKCHVDDKGGILIPAMALKQMVDLAAQRLGEQIPGKGKKTYAPHFLSGVICENDVALPGLRADTALSQTISANANGRRGGGTRVDRTFPQWPKWGGVARFVIMDDVVTREVFERTFVMAGRFVGLGRFRPANGGLNGRLQVVKFTWEDL